MDFSLVGKDEQFNLESYFPSITEEFQAAGRDVVIIRKEKRKETKIESKEFNGVDLNQETFIEMLKERLGSTGIKMVRRDVLPFVQNPKELDIWSNDYFLQLADRIDFCRKKWRY